MSEDNEPCQHVDERKPWWKQAGRALAWFAVAAPGWWPIVEHFLA